VSGHHVALVIGGEPGEGHHHHQPSAGAACEPEIVDVADCLNKMSGARVTERPARRVSWSKAWQNFTARATPCCRTGSRPAPMRWRWRLTGGDVQLSGARPELLQSALDVLRQAGVVVNRRTMKAFASPAMAPGSARVIVSTAPIPGFPTDLQAQAGWR